MKNWLKSTLKSVIASSRHGLNTSSLRFFSLLFLGTGFLTAIPIRAQQTLCQQLGGNFVPDITIGTNEFSTTNTSGLGVAIWTNKKVVVNGTLIVDSDFHIQSCQLKMGKNASIRINAGKIFFSTFSKYFRCGSDRWTGFADQGGTSGIWFNHIEDASIAIDILSANAKVTLVGNFINRNRIGVRAANIAVNATIAANVFDCTSPLNAGGSMGMTGISLTNCSSAAIGRIDPTPAFRNTFNKHANGINLTNSTASIGLSNFRGNDIGVLASKSTVTIRGAASGLTSNFANNGRDIYATQTNLDVFYCHMDSCKTNNITSVSNNNQERIHIHDNTIQVTNLPNAANSKMGISLDRSRFGNDNEYRNTIDRNHFIIHEFAGSERRAMHIRGGASIHDYMRIDSNFIEAKAGGNSDILTKFVDIDISGAENFHITNNTLNTTNTFATGNNRWGFFMVNGATTPAEGNKFWFNTITGIGPDDGCCAVHALDAGPWSICSNTTDQTYRGFHFTGNCGKSVFGLNTFNNHNYDPLQLYVGGTGLFMQGHGADNAFLGIQECQSNHWEIVDYAFPNAYTAIIIGNELNGPSNPTLQKNEFRVENLNDAHQAPIDRNPMQNWFKMGDCLLAPTGCVEQDLNAFDEHDIWVRDHYPYPQATPGVEEWQSTRYVLAKLMRYPNLASGATLTFRNAYSQSSAALFARFDSLMNAISLATTASQTTLNGIYANIQSKQAQINALDATVSDYSAIPTGMLSDRAVLLGELAALTVQLNTLQAQNESVRLPLLAACEQFNNALPANQTYEQNQKVLNALAIQQARGIELSETDKTALHAIAQQCTQVAGRTKEAAAAMLPPEESGPYWHEDPNVDNCPQRTSRDATLQELGCTLSPNPVSDMLHLQFDAPFIGSLVISDLSGRVIQRLSATELTKALDIPVNQLTNGVYLATCTDQGKNWSASVKFVVLR